MNKENASKLWKVIQEDGDYLMDYRIFSNLKVAGLNPTK